MTDSIVEVLTSEGIEQVMNQWESVYCPLSKKEKEKIYFNDYKWHVFSNDAYASITGEKALEEYNKQIARLFYVIPEVTVWPNEVAFICNKLPPSNLMAKSKDFYVFPKNLAWSMAFTHEHGWLGPYFSKHKDYTSLNNKNAQSVDAKDRIKGVGDN